MKIKYLEERERKKGNVWVVNPPPYVREATGMAYRQFGKDREAAVQYAEDVAAAFEASRREAESFSYVDRKSVEGLFRFYMTTPGFTERRANTRKGYRADFNWLLSTRLGTSNILVGEMLAHRLTPDHALRLYNLAFRERGKCAAHNFVKRMRTIWTVALASGRTEHSNPWCTFKLETIENRKALWTEQEIWDAIDRADDTGYHSLGSIILFCYHLCQRPGDGRNLKWSNLHDNYSRTIFNQEKTGVEIMTRLTPDLIARVEDYHLPHRTDMEMPVFYDTRRNRPYTHSSITEDFQKIRKHLNLHHVRLQDLRRTGATEMSDRNCTDQEMMNVTGHTQAQTLRIYINRNERKTDNAMDKRFGSRPARRRPNNDQPRA